MTGESKPTKAELEVQIATESGKRTARKAAQQKPPATEPVADEPPVEAPATEPVADEPPVEAPATEPVADEPLVEVRMRVSDKVSAAGSTRLVPVSTADRMVRQRHADLVEQPDDPA